MKVAALHKSKRRRASRAFAIRARRSRGVALVMAMVAVAILATMLAEMQENTTSAFVVAANERDQLRAEYMAKSGLNLTRLLIGQEPAIRQIVSPLYQMALGRPPPMIPVWSYANAMLQPFCNAEAAREAASQSGYNLSAAQGLDDPGATCEIVAFAENSRLNISKPLNFTGTQAQQVVAMQIFAQTGGYHSPSPYDDLFSEPDADGQYTSRLDIISAMIDWWDFDTERTQFDPGAGTVTNGGAEDDVYSRFRDRYKARNAPFDSIEELRLVRGIGDDFWSTFIEPDPEDPRSRLVTIYGSGAVNPNEAHPRVLLSRICSFLSATTLCTDQTEAAKFIQLFITVRQIAPLPFFSTPDDFVNFLSGQGGPRDLYPLLQGLLGPGNPLLFTPVPVDATQRTAIAQVLVTGARILTIDVTGHAGRGTTRLRTVMNFHDRWTPPPPNPGVMPALGIFHYYRVE